MTRDPVAVLHALRPDEHDLDALWPQASRIDTVEQILDQRRGLSRRHRYVFGAAGIAAAAAVALTLPWGTADPGTSALPPAQPAAVTMALHRLAGVAAQGTAEDGPVWHLIVRENQTDDSTTTHESWTDHTGRTWRHDTVTGDSQAPASQYLEFPPVTSDIGDLSPTNLDRLPTTRDALYAFLDAHVTGSSSHEEAIFVGIGDMLRGGFAPPALRTAAIQVLTELPHVTLGDATTDTLGRAVQEFEFVDASTRPGEVQSMSFDPGTAQILDEGIDGGPLHYVSTVIDADAVAQVPADVLDRAVLQHN